MLVVAQAGLTTLQMDSPIDLSYLVDTVIALKYYEKHAEINRLISVFKKRPGEHERVARMLHIGPDRFNVGDRITELHHVLAAFPRYEPHRQGVIGDGAAGV